MSSNYLSNYQSVVYRKGRKGPVCHNAGRINYMTKMLHDQLLFYSRFEALSIYHLNNNRSISFSYVIFLDLPGSVFVRTGATYEKLNQYLFNKEKGSENKF